MMTVDRRILPFLQQRQEQMLADLQQFVAKESPSSNKSLVDECGRFVQQLFQQRLGVLPEVIPQTDVGNFLKYTIGGGEQQILVVGHLDTVWDSGSLSYRVEGNRAYGPGIYDMKGGIVQVLWALAALRELAIPLRSKVVFLLNTDEEIGSVQSRALIEECAKQSTVVLIPEPPEALTGALKTARKGWGAYTVKIRGRSAHAGNHHEDGVNAVEEAARHILWLQQLTDYAKGTTVNVGVVQGGTRFNVVPDYAELQIDLRVATPAEEARLHSLISGLKPTRHGISLEVTGGIGRPAMVRSANTAELAAVAKSIAEELGFALGEATVGGTSDGNFTAALGIPTLDGLGAEGDGAHALHEHILIDSLAKRSALFANLLCKL